MVTRTTHEFIQGSPEWQQFRLEHHGASEAAAMLGLSKKTTRNELLRMKHTGSAKEFSDWVQTNILDYGHEVEALARTIVEDKIGEELYPVTISMGRLSASCDGLTMGGDRAFEHKQWNAELAAAVQREELPDEHMPQCQQIMLVTGTELVIFVVSDGTLENYASMVVLPDASWQERIVAGWRQFDEDLAVYIPQEVIPKAIAEPQAALPALAVQLQGQIVISGNLGRFGGALRQYIDGLNRKPETDQDFANLDAAVKSLKEAEKSLDAAEQMALGQAPDLDQMRREVEDYRQMARTTRLMLEKLVEAEKTNRREAIRSAGVKAYDQYIREVNETLGKPFLSTAARNIPEPQFAQAMKGKKTLESLQNAVDTELARCKIEVGAISNRMLTNLTTLRTTGKDHSFLFADTAQIIMKPPEDLRMLVTVRINTHEQEQRDKLEAEREKIRIDEERKAREKVDAAEKARLDAIAKAPEIAAPPPEFSRAPDHPPKSEALPSSPERGWPLATRATTDQPVDIAASIDRIVTICDDRMITDSDARATIRAIAHLASKAMCSMKATALA